jgi:hypothetical protein
VVLDSKTATINFFFLLNLLTLSVSCSLVDDKGGMAGVQRRKKEDKGHKFHGGRRDMCFPLATNSLAPHSLAQLISMVKIGRVIRALSATPGAERRAREGGDGWVGRVDR